MQNINNYIDKAKALNSLKSDRQLSVALGLTGPAVQRWRSGISIPNDETMVRLAKMANVAVDQALLELAYWRTDGVAKRTYASILKRIAVFALGFIAVFSASPAFASVAAVASAGLTFFQLFANIGAGLYILWKIICSIRWLFIKSTFKLFK